MANFDEAYAVSDLHLGGSTGGQIFDQGPLLAGLVRTLAARPKKNRVALVLNGDVVDFLAEADASYLDPLGAAAKLRRIAGDPAFADVFAALAAFAATPNRELVIALGNHDVELALPEVRDTLLELLAGEDAASRGRIAFALDGAGYACTVNERRVVFLHGNEADAWNVVDHEALRKVALALNAGRRPPEWSPNAGTRLVVDLMNEVKRRHPFVDLLKPEVRSVPKVLLAVEDGLREKLGRLAPVLAQAARDHVLFAFGLLGAEDKGVPPEGAGEATALEWLLSDERQPAPPAGPTAGADLYLELEKRYQERARGATPAVPDELLGLPGLVIDRFRRRDPAENLREALQGWFGAGPDKTFAMDGPDPGFDGLTQLVGADVPFLVAGHTHLRRCLARPGGVYYNSGTWARLIQLTPGHLATPEAFAPVYKALRAGSMAALESVTGLVRREPTVVCIDKLASGTRGRMATAVMAAGGKVELAFHAETERVY